MNLRRKIFCDEFNKSIEALGMKDWDIKFEEKAIKADEAQIAAFPSTRVAKVILSTTCEEARIPLVARHEAFHLFLALYRQLATSRYVEERELDMEEERLCTVMEKVCF
jgi:hypothetical protein